MTPGLWLLTTVVSGALVLDGIARLWQRLHPSSYFSVGNLITGFDDTPGLRALLLRLAVPFVVGLIVSALNPDSRISSAAFSGGLGALLLVWVPILYPESLPRGTWGRRSAVRAVLVLFTVTYVAVAVAGALIGQVLERPLLDQTVLRSFTDWIAATSAPNPTDILASLIAAGILAVVVPMAAFIRRLSAKLLTAEDDSQHGP